MLFEILRFYRQSRKLLRDDSPGVTLGQYVNDHGYSSEFVERHLIPMGAAIWSADPQQFYEFPIGYFVRFCDNHGMLNVFRRPQWRVIRGGSIRYVEKLTAPYRSRHPAQHPGGVHSTPSRAGGSNLGTVRNGVFRPCDTGHAQRPGPATAG